MGEVKLENKDNVVELDSYCTKYIEKFLSQKSHGSKNTSKAYEADIRQFFELTFGRNYTHVKLSELQMIHSEMIEEYFERLFQKNDYASLTKNRKQSSIRELIKYLSKKRLVDINISDLSDIKSHKSTRNVDYMPLDRSLQYTEYMLNHERNKNVEKYCFILLAIDIGKRVSSILNLKWSNFTVDNETQEVIVVGIDKGTKRYIEKIDLGFYTDIKSRLYNGNDGDKLFTLQYHDLTNALARAKKFLKDENKNYTIHSFKRVAVTATYRMTGDILEAQKKGSHSNIETTRLYLETEEAKVNGVISLMNQTDDELYLKVTHQELLEAIGELKRETLFIVNKKISEVQNRKNKLEESLKITNKNV